MAFYVDDVITGAGDEAHAYQLYQASKEILKAGGFNLRKFCSNSVLLQMQIDASEAPDQHIHPHIGEAEETYVSSTLGPSHEEHSEERKVLGVRWDIATDRFVISLESIASAAAELEPTKRAIVSLVGKFYDPLGILSPIVIGFKIFLQELCEAKLDWDQSLTGKLLEKWHRMTVSLREDQQIFLTPRCYLNDLREQIISYTLCGFCDASLKAYAAVVYLQVETSSGHHVSFVASKTRVSPLKAQTIPRLELLSALLLARLLSTVTQALQSELGLSSPLCYTDSTVALHWIRGVEKSWKPFVQNRVSEIRRILPPDHWMHCSGKENPADLPSRGLTTRELAASRLWMNGPDWLKDGEPGGSPDPLMPGECLAELKTEVTHGLLTPVEPLGIDQLLKCEDFSSLHRLLSVTAHVLKFCNLLLSKVRPDTASADPDVLFRAEGLWISASQRMLMKDKKFSQWKSQFGLFQDDVGIWRCAGRIQNADVPFSTKHPILLSKDHHLTTLFVLRAHERVMHSGVKATLTELRARFWIPKGRSMVRRILHRCTVCRRFEGQPYHAPPPPPLPPFRVEEAPPFTHTGVDFAGPLYVRGEDGSSSKVWICLYTCCVTRAVHLDLVPNLSTEAFIRSLKRFAARRGLPAKMVSDNGKTFKAAVKLIHSIVSHDDVQQHLAGLEVQWVFNLPKAPWWGGLFERLIRSTKRCLRKVIGQARLSYDELSTALIEVEAVLNSRPLTYITGDDLDEALTPSHLLAGRRVLSLPDHISRSSEEEVVGIDRDHITRRARHLNNTINQFWERWKEYLLELREAHRYHRGHANPSQVSVEDVVIVHTKDQRRGFWKLCRVKEVLVGPDGGIRGAVVQVAGRGRQATSLHRPIQLLYPLEVSLPGRESEHDGGTPSDPEQTSTVSDQSDTAHEPPQDEPDVKSAPHPLPR